ncbi:hypothetical protein CPB86DRAFT_706987 [Serendipita vermifera]|nr:hypothetical protein CPB86DRAFT_706987 [Serendipita vermifera]
MSALEFQALGGRPLSVVANEIATSRWTSAIALAILCYDTVLTLGEEIQFIWPKRWSSIKTLAYLNRFVSFSFILTNAYALSAINRSLSNGFCEVLLLSTGVAAYLSFAMSNWILLARTQALLGDSRIFKYCIIAFYIVSYSATAVLVTKSSVDLTDRIFYSKTVRACGIASRPPTLGFVWVGSMIFETTIFVITILKLYQKASQTYSLGSNLLMVLYRDGVCYYFVTLRIFNMISWMVFPISHLFVGFFLLWAIMCISVTRLQLNLLKAVDPLQPSSTSHLPGMRRFTRAGPSVVLTRGHHDRGISTSTPAIQLRSMRSTRHGTRSYYKSHELTATQTGTFAHISTFQEEDEYGRVRGLEVSMQSFPEEDVAVTRPTTMIVPSGPRIIVTMTKEVQIDTDNKHSASSHQTGDSIV